MRKTNDGRKKFLKIFLSNELFVKFLKKHRSLKKFKRNLMETEYPPTDDDDIYNVKRNIYNAFHWMNTEEGYYYWKKLSDKLDKIMKPTCKLKRKY